MRPRDRNRSLASRSASGAFARFALVAVAIVTLVVTIRPSSAQELGEGGLRVRWRADAGRAIDFTPRLDSTSVYVATTDPRVVAYDLASGERRWSKRMKQSISAPLELGPNRVYVPLGDDEPKLRALEATNGDVAWTVAVEAPPVALSLRGDAIIVLEQNGTLECFEVKEGTRRWMRGGLGPSPAGVASDDSTLFVVARRDSILALARETGRPRWKVAIPGRRAAAPVLSSERLVVISADGREAHLDVRNGVELSTATRESYQLSPSLPIDGLLVSASSGGVVEAWDPERRAMRWSMALGAAPAGPPVDAGGHLFVLRRTGRLTILRIDKGDEAWSLELPGEFAVPPCSQGDFLLLAGERGDLYVYGRDDES